MAVDITTLKQIVCEAVTTHADEMSCAECFDRIDRYAELVVRGEPASHVMARVHGHIAHCRECREEVEMLILILGPSSIAPLP